MSPTPEEVKRALAGGVDLSALKQPRRELPVVTETKHLLANFAFGWDEGGRPLVVFDIPAAPGVHRIAFAFTPEALEQYRATLNGFVDSSPE